jgi:hypothetical protein
MTDCMLSLTLDSHGCRVVQTVSLVLTNSHQPVWIVGLCANFLKGTRLCAGKPTRSSHPQA